MNRDVIGRSPSPETLPKAMFPGPVRARRPSLALHLACALAVVPIAGDLSGQVPARGRTEQVTYVNARDGTQLTASLALPPGSGPHPGVLVMSVAGTRPLVDRLLTEGYAVLTPMLRGFVEVEPLLQATYADLAGDLEAGLSYMGSRPDIDPHGLALVAQAENTAPAMLVGASERSIPLVLLAPPAFPGVEVFQLEQRWIAEGAGAAGGDLAALDRYIEGIAEIALSGTAPYAKEYRLQGLRAGSRVDLPPNAAFPSDERQAHFFASPIWHDRLAFQPEAALAGLRSPVMILIGAEEPYTPMDRYLAAVRRGLAAGAVADGTVCRIPGRTRHTFSVEAATAVTGWLAGRVGQTEVRSGSPAVRPPGCMEDEAR